MTADPTRLLPLFLPAVARVALPAPVRIDVQDVQEEGR